jgi:hypothetical protein
MMLKMKQNLKSDSPNQKTQSLRKPIRHPGGRGRLRVVTGRIGVRDQGHKPWRRVIPEFCRVIRSYICCIQAGI